MSNRRYRVFISHSANPEEEPSTQEFLDQLTDKINTDNKLEVISDQRSLEAGDDWCQQLYAWVGLCDAAIILLSPRAVTRENSVWVPREVNIMLWRKARDSNFLVIPVLVSGLQYSQISDNPFLADVGLTDLQFVRENDDQKKIDDIHEKLSQKAESSQTVTAFSAVQASVEDSIARFAAKRSVKSVMDEYFSEGGWNPYEQAEDLLAIKMVGHAVHPQIDTIIENVSVGSQPDYGLGNRLLKTLFPLRLPAEPACGLHILCAQNVGINAIVLNCQDGWFVRMLLRSATGHLHDELDRKWGILELPDGWGDEDVEEIINYLAIELAELTLGTGGWDMIENAEDRWLMLNRVLEDYTTRSGNPILVCTRYSKRWCEIAAIIVDKIPSIVLLFWSGKSMPGDDAVRTTGVVQVEPSLPVGLDQDLKFNYRLTMQRLGGLT